MSTGGELIVTEKENAARRIASILSGGRASDERIGGVTVYRWDDRWVVGLSGHVVGVDFPSEYEDWRAVEPVELVDAAIEKSPTKQDIVETLQSLATDASRVTIATDYDREGELIGKEAYDLVRAVNPDVPVDRVRFSSITETEVRNAFENPDEIDFDLAAAGEARQVIDLIWGAALTRFLSLSARQLGDDFISVGRVQSPTLRLIVDREREIRAFEPEDYWELFVDLATDGESFEAQYFYLDDDNTETERVWNEADAEAAEATLSGNERATVTSVNRRTRTDYPPAPFNTTQFIKAAGSLGYAAGQAMSIAEDLYTDGYITYPRTDNTVYPDDLDPDALLAEFVGHHTLGDDASSLRSADIEPTRGDEQTTDHPPIHPTGEVPDRSALSDDEWSIYELVVRRFFGTVADPATWHHLRVVASADGLSVKANGKRLVEAGYHAVYPYFSTSENYVPDVEEGQELLIEAVRLEAKQTQPPRRYGQSGLIEKMEELGIGTKCLTGDTKVLVYTDGEVDPVPISNLFEENRIAMADGDANIAVVPDGPRTISFVEANHTIVPRDSDLVSKRPVRDDERVLRVVTSRGSFSVTEDHPVYIRSEGGFTIMPANAVEPGDEILATGPSAPGPVEAQPIVEAGAEPAPERPPSRQLTDSNGAKSVGQLETHTNGPVQELPGPVTSTVVSIGEREYTGAVYDLSVSDAAPNFAVEGGLFVHNSTRHNTLDKLYDRGYIEENPPRPTQLAMAVVEAAEEFADMIVSEEMTQQLETDMAAIANGDATLEEVTDESREMLERVFDELDASRDAIGDHLRESLKADKVLGPCPESDHDLLIRRSRYGSTFVGCDGYPDCQFTLPLPDKGEPLVIDETCDDHNLRHVKMLAGRNTFVHGCPRCAEDSAGEGPVIGSCPECGTATDGNLVIKTLRNGSRLVGCTRYPDCEYSLPLPRRGDIEVTDRYCEQHELPELVVHDGDDPWELGCPICNFQEYRARKASSDGLEVLDGVGGKTADKFHEAGIETVTDLLDAEPETLASQVDGVSADRIREWQSAAAEFADATAEA